MSDARAYGIVHWEWIRVEGEQSILRYDRVRMSAVV